MTTTQVMYTPGRNKKKPLSKLAPSSVEKKMDAAKLGHNKNNNNDGYDDKEELKTHGAAITFIRWLESIRVPPCLLVLLGNNNNKTKVDGNGNDNDNDDNNVDDDRPRIISGLERVLFGTQPAADVVKIFSIHPPRYLCYMVSGSLCDVIQFAIDVVLHMVFHLQDPSLCWAIGIGSSVVFRHTSHRYLVFGDYVGGYWASLGRMYAGYSIIIVLSTAFNFVMTRNVHMSHYMAWIVTLLWTGIVNYFILKKLWSFGGAKHHEKVDPEHDDHELGVSSSSKPPPSSSKSTLDVVKRRFV